VPKLGGPRLLERFRRLVSTVSGLVVVLAVAMAVGGLLGAIGWSASGHPVQAAATVRVVDDQTALASVLAGGQSTATGTDFVSGEVARLSSPAFAQALSTTLHRPVQPLTVNQVATSDLVQLSVTDVDADRAVATLNAALTAYLKGRQASAQLALAADLQATARRLDALNQQASSKDAVTVEVARLLAHQSDLVAAQARLPDMVPVVDPPAQVPDEGLSGGLLSTVVGALLLGLVAALGAAAIRLRDQSIRTPTDLTALGYRVLMPVFDLSRRGSWEASVRVILAQLPGVYRNGALLLIAVDREAKADVVAGAMSRDPIALGLAPVGPSSVGASEASDPAAGQADPARPAVTALDVNAILSRRTDPNENAILVVALGRTRRQAVMGALRAVNAAGMTCSGVILTSGELREDMTDAAAMRHVA
jgi:hypothetical protein